jgi:hypothetical protein
MRIVKELLDPDRIQPCATLLHSVASRSPSSLSRHFSLFPFSSLFHTPILLFLALPIRKPAFSR